MVLAFVLEGSFNRKNRIPTSEEMFLGVLESDGEEAASSESLSACRQFTDWESFLKVFLEI